MPVTTSRSLQPLHFLLFDAQHFVHHRVRAELDVGMRHRPLQHDLRRAELRPPMQQRHLARKARQKQRLFHRRVAAAHHRNRLVAEEEPVARRAARNAMPDQRLLARQSQPARARARRNNQRPRRESRPPTCAAGTDALPVPPDPDAPAETPRQTAPPASSCCRSVPVPGFPPAIPENSPPAK